MSGWLIGKCGGKNGFGDCSVLFFFLSFFFSFLLFRGLGVGRVGVEIMASEC